MPSINEEILALSNGTVLIWNRDTGSIRDMGTFRTPTGSSALQFFDIDVASDGTVFGLAGGVIYELDLLSNLATRVGVTGGNGLEITRQGDFLVSGGATITLRSGTDLSVLETYPTSGGNPGTGPSSAGDVQLIGNTMYMSGTNDVLVGLNIFSGLEVDRVTDPVISGVYGLSTAGNELIYYAGLWAYREVGGSLERIEGFAASASIYGAADTHFPAINFNPTQGADVLLGSFFSDIIYGLGGRDNIVAGFGDDLIIAGAGADNVAAGQGYDVAYGGGGADTLSGGGGNDTIFGGGGADQVYGGGGDDLVGGAAGNDRVYGGTGADVAGGGAGNDQVYGGRNDDIIYGARGSDQVFGNAGDDTVYGGNDNDTVLGGWGDDELFGGSGDDRLVGGLDSDTLRGGLGDDTFVLADGDGQDYVEDFGNGNDMFDFSRVTAVTSYNDLLINHTSESFGAVRFDFGGGLEMIALDTTVADLSFDLFIF